MAIRLVTRTRHLLSSGFISAEKLRDGCSIRAIRSFRCASVRSVSMYLSPGGFQLASDVGSIQPDPTARGCGLTSGSDADPW